MFIDEEDMDSGVFAISLVADRVIDSRQELKGYFKNQINVLLSTVKPC
jgi:hypothetical protein